jgi:ubiquinone biosynthesis protein
VRTLTRHPRRVWDVISVFLEFYIRPRLPFRRSPPLPGPVRARLALERLGGAWIKLGQMLAMRFDLLPPAYCDELFKLLNQVKPFPYDQVRQIIRQELGDDPEVIFRSFETQSFAAASIGQVHRAVLHTGEHVAVKVQRPGIRAILQSDIELMYAFGGVLNRTHFFGATKSREVIDEFARWTADELDYLVEARQAVLLYEHAQGEALERIARVYREYTTSRVLTAELIEGIPLIDIILARRERNTAYLDALAARGYDLDLVVRHLDWNMLNQVYVFGYFHADLHPANLFVLPGNAIGYVDFGIVGQIPDRVRESLIRYSWLLFQGEVEDAITELMRWLAPSAATDTAAARWQLIRVHQAFLYETNRAQSDLTVRTVRPGDPGADNPYSKLSVDIMKIVRDNELTLSRTVVAYLKMLVTLGTLRHQLASDYDLPRHVRRFFGRLVRQEGLRWLDPRMTLTRMYDSRIRLQRALEFVEFIEAQEPLITEATNTLFGIRLRMRNARRTLINLGISVLLVAGALYFVLADPHDASAVLPRDMPLSWVHVTLLGLLIILIMVMINHVRRFGSED